MSWVFLSLLSGVAVAQIQDGKAYSRFGLMAGANISLMNFKKGYGATNTGANTGWQAAFSLGGNVTVPLAKKLYLQPEYRFTQRRGGDKSLLTTYTFNYLSLPVLFNYRCTNRLGFLAGPQLELLINATAKTLGVKTTITHDTEERSIGAAAGLTYSISRSIIISPRYFMGLNHIGIGQRSNIKEFTYQAFSMLLVHEF